MRKFSSRSSSRSSSSLGRGSKATLEESLMAIRGTIWPRPNLERFTEILDASPNLVKMVVGEKGDTLLHRITAQNREEFVSALLQRGADVDAVDDNGWTALHIACHQKLEKSVDVLVAAGANVNLKNSAGDAACQLACLGGSLDILKTIMENSICEDPSSYDHSDHQYVSLKGCTLMHCAAQTRSTEVMEYLIKNGCHVNATNALGETPLHIAAATHFDEPDGTNIIRFLLEKGADIGARTLWGDTAAHYAALKGTREVLDLVCAKGASIVKDKDNAGYRAAIQRLRDDWDYEEEECEKMGMTFLQKVARSGCYRKSDYAVDRMMEARHWYSERDLSELFAEKAGHKYRPAFCSDLTEEQLEFKSMANEFRLTMAEPNSALRLFLRHSPDSVERLLNHCLISGPCTSQVMGRVIFDFGMLFPEPMELGRCETCPVLEAIEIIVLAKKGRFLSHPLIEAYLKLKWFATWRIYGFFLLIHVAYLLSIIGFAYVQFSGEQYISDPMTRAWRASLTFWTAVMGFIIITEIINSSIRRLKHGPIKGLCVVLLDGGYFCDVTSVSLSIALLAGDMDYGVAKAVCAAFVFIATHAFTRILSRLPYIGVNFFMIKMVMFSILKFLLSYIFHFVGYAVAFHILLPDTEAFSDIGGSMLLGEYDYGDTYADSTWPAKLLFVIFVIDMSVVLMNLVIGLAVNDVDSIQRQSRMMRMLSESNMVAFLEEWAYLLRHLPFMRKVFGVFNIPRMNFCCSDFTYLDLVDTVNNAGNKIIFNSSSDGDGKTFSCPSSIFQSAVKILSERFQECNGNVATEANLETQERIMVQNKELQEKVVKMEEQMAALVGAVTNISAKLDSTKL